MVSMENAALILTEALRSYINHSLLINLDVVPLEEDPSTPIGSLPIRIIAWEIVDNERQIREIREQAVRIIPHGASVSVERFVEYAHGTAMAAAKRLSMESDHLASFPEEFFCAEILLDVSVKTRERFANILLGADGIRRKLEIERDYDDLLARYPELPRLHCDEQRDWVRLVFSRATSFVDACDALDRIESTRDPIFTPYLARIVDHFSTDRDHVFSTDWIPIPKTLAERAGEIIKSWALSGKGLSNLLGKDVEG